jgi:hypothetical protein
LISGTGNPCGVSDSNLCHSYACALGSGVARVRSTPSATISSPQTTIVWELAGFVDVMRCELVRDRSGGYALGLHMGDELILAEWWHDEPSALRRANEIQQRLLSRGWLPRD